MRMSSRSFLKDINSYKGTEEIIIDLKDVVNL